MSIIFTTEVEKEKKLTFESIGFADHPNPTDSSPLRELGEAIGSKKVWDEL